jgi:hypothetical protein
MKRIVDYYLCEWKNSTDRSVSALVSAHNEAVRKALCSLAAA